jgi:parvulin-like peptidyl-prolyl isomerase
MRRFSRLLAALLAVAACDRAPTRPLAVEVRHASLGAGIAARVGVLDVPTSLVADVARAARSEPRVALERLVDDALAAQGAEAAGESRAPATSWALESVVATSTTEHVRVAAAAAGPPSDAEVKKLSEVYWRDVDLPEQVRVIHAVVLRPKDAAQLDAARALATRLTATLAGATSDDDFEARAKGFPAAPFKIVVEHLPSFVLDGRIAEGEPRLLDTGFARGAFALQKPTDTSGVVESTSGFHVIRLIERRPPKVVPFEERRARFAAEIYAGRSRDALESLLDARRTRTPVEIQLGADARMEAAASSAP